MHQPHRPDQPLSARPRRALAASRLAASPAAARLGALCALCALLLAPLAACESTQGVKPPPLSGPVNPAPPPSPPTAASPSPSATAPATAPATNPATPPATAPAPKAQSDLPAITRHPAPSRIIAIGDVHGDLAATRAALRLAGLIDDQDRWTGGDAALVQTGDLLDRGDDEIEILTLLQALQPQALAAGGHVFLMSGNHEVMNVQGDLRYVTPDGFQDFVGLPLDGAPSLDDPSLSRAPDFARPRLAAFAPGATFARQVAAFPIVLLVGDTLFAHGGVLPDHVRYGLDRINAEAAAWMNGQAPMPAILSSDTSPIWSRHFSGSDPDDTPCALLQETLRLTRAKRLVIGHTPQLQGITSACDGQVWRIDTGMARHYQGPTQVLEIQGDTARALR
jgi:hypothetical protein